MTENIREETPTETLVEGAISVRAVLEADSRPVFAVLLRRGKNDGPTRRLENLAAQRDIPVEHLPDEAIETLTKGNSHGGVFARVGPRRFSNLDALLPENHAPFIALLDGVEDPFNFGQAVRSLHAAGADGLVVRPRNWLSAAGVVARASAGASERLPMAVAETTEEAARFFAARDLFVAVSDDDAHGSVSVFEADLTVPLFLIIGGEKRGITRSFRDRADLRLHIPANRAEAHALGTAAAAAVLAFEVMRQRSR